MIEQFKIDVLEGLGKNPKALSSKYFYDEIGDDLFVQIMNMPEYYLTNSEFEIFRKKTKELMDSFTIQKNEPFELIELGAGDGTKTKELLKVLLNENYTFNYSPIDISANALNLLEKSLNKDLPELNVSTMQGDYFQVLSSFKNNPIKKVILFLGSNIGNLSDEQSENFITKLSNNINTNDVLVLGVDLIKDSSIVLPAYSDKEGITSKFNLNLLSRINKELGGDFQVNDFVHLAEYNDKEGVARSFLVSKKKQTITIKSLDTSFSFENGEKIHTEISRKYNDVIIQKIINPSDFVLTNSISDSKKYFTNYILTKWKGIY